MYNTFFAASYQVIILAAGFIVPRFMLQYYGSEINGLITSITQFINYFNLIEAGLSGASVYALYKPLAENNYKEISAVVVATKRFYMISGYLFLLLLAILAVIYPFKVHVNGLNSWQVMILILLLGFSGVLEFFTLGKYRALLTADQKLFIISISSILYTILNTAILVALSMIKMNIVIVKAVSLSAILLRSFILYQYTQKNYPYINYAEPPNSRALDKRWDALYLQILGTIHTGAPVIIATVFTNLKMVSVYSIYNMVVGGISGVLSIFTNGLSSSFGDIIVRNEIQTLQKAYQEFELAYYSLIAVVYSVSFIMIMPFIRLYTGNITDINYDIPILGILFVLNALLHNLKTPQGMLVISAGHYKETKVQVTIQGMIAVVGGILLAPLLGLNGILLGAIAANVYRDIDLFYYIPKKITKLPLYTTLKRVGCMIIEIIIICIPFRHFTMICKSYLQWAWYAVIVTLYAILIVLIFGILFNRKELQGIWKRLLVIGRKVYGNI
ncbi:MAG: hypothetical protein HFI31_00430 [Lachnospiraceae bacterium]|nr:hypothetical protein [Lachnospiraceae bacterium]